MLRIGAWQVNPASSQISRNGESAHLEARALRLLMCLADHAGEVVSIDHLLDEVWAGVNVAPDSVYQAVASLRRLLGDDPRHPNYIETIPRLGYRLVAEVSQDNEVEVKATTAAENELPSPSATVGDAPPARRRFLSSLRWASLAGLVGLIIASAVVLVLRGKAVNKMPLGTIASKVPEHRKSIAVLPFVDLTEGMKAEEFADGMTEELIDRFSKNPCLRVPAPTAAFYFKNKQPSLSDIGKALGVGYVLDGSVRKSGGRVRVAARLFCADSGYVIWSETYDRPFGDALALQDQIADEVAKALKASMHSEPQPARLQ